MKYFYLCFMVLKTVGFLFLSTAHSILCLSIRNIKSTYTFIHENLFLLLFIIKIY